MNTYEWAPLRVVPRVDRGECLNVGVLLYCRHAVVLTMRLALDGERLAAVFPELDVDEVSAAVRAWPRTVAGEGPAGVLSPGERFRWLTAPRSTVVQAGPVHTGLTADPEAEVDRLLARLV
ncbi:DUF3037 domain-containing protein [Actinomycetospora termitidis]|uniref:DUF3037 domain-containing protein n=1 Tax=Actinomycetospora termitidis TaxID=3053470 RepID=A0ABT7M8B4_9PSEU|nr:DUF3037 domain-containing protein [Actinomycetospora sp. Odt1-22]MDL5156434.1 DUF3037 domain-containing protein [Actinomycetospora sp. Odt1-22]